MKPFHFKQFSILQDKNVFRVGTDGVLLGALASCEAASKVLEVGTGHGANLFDDCTTKSQSRDFSA